MTLETAVADFSEFLVQASPRQRRLVVPALEELAEAARPGARVIAALRAEQARSEALFQAELRREFKLLGQLVAVAASLKGGLILESKASVRRRIAEILAASRISTWVKERLKPIYDFHYKQTADATFKTLSKQGIPMTFRRDVEAVILEKGGRRLGLLDIEGDTRRALFAVIQEAREKGLNPTVVSRLIEEHVPKGRYVNAGSRYRAKLIARTETLHAQRLSSIAGYRQSPAVKEVIAFDGDKDAECANRNGRTMTFDEAEIEIESTHPNCVLSFGPVT